MTVTAPDLRARLAAHLRISSSVTRMWTTPVGVVAERYALRLESVRKRWPELAALLDALAESVLDAQDEQQLVAGAAQQAGCPICGGPVTRVRQSPNPKYAFDRPGYRVEDGQRDSTSVHLDQWTYRVDPCLHEVVRDDVKEMWDAGIPVDTQPLDGIALVGAEVERIRVDRGYTLEHDQQHDSGQLAWAAWCILDRMGNPDDTSVPASWPFDPTLWKPGQTPIRALTVVAGMAISEIDRRLAEQRDQQG